MTRRLTRVELGCLVQADTHGEYFPVSKDTIEACQRLVGWELMGEHDGSPGRYWITSAGECEMQRALAIRHVERV